MMFEVSCPSKTFLLGEYLVLNDGPAMLINTSPRFKLLVNSNGDGTVDGIAPESPAGLVVRKNNRHFAKTELTFQDPHFGLGGFGASSAQYLFVQIATELFNKPALLKNIASSQVLGKNGDESVARFDIEEIWRTYRASETISQEGLRPSGADVVAQYFGGLCNIKTEPFSAKSYNWPFLDYDFILAHTGRKLVTHEHLRALRRVNTDELGEIFSRAVETLNVKDASAFFDSVNDYYAELLELDLVSDFTKVAVASLLAQPFVQAAKGCGAMGNDVIAVFFAKDYKPQVQKILASLGVNCIAGSSDISSGYKVEMLRAEDQRPAQEGRI